MKMSLHSMPTPLWAPQTPGNTYHPLLNAALKPMQDEASIADWLFRCPWNVYRTDVPRLTTYSFSNAQSLNLVHLENNDDGQPSMQLASEATMQLIPAARTRTGGIVGYLLSYGNGADVKSRPFGAIPGIPGLPVGRAQFHGRFLYDTQSSHLIITLVHSGGNLLSVASFKTVGDGRRERMFFTLPLREYTSENLRDPSIITAISTLEFRTHTAKAHNSSRDHEECPTSPTGRSSQSPWLPDWTNDWKDMSSELIAAEVETSLSSASRTGLVDQCIDVWDLSGISVALEKLREDMLGTFYAPAIKLDIVSKPTSLTHGSTSFTTLVRGQLHAQVSLANTYVQAELRELAVQTHHMQGLHLASPAALNMLPTLPTYCNQSDNTSYTSILEELFCEAATSNEANSIVGTQEGPDESDESLSSKRGNFPLTVGRVQRVMPAATSMPSERSYDIQTQLAEREVVQSTSIPAIPYTKVPWSENNPGSSLCAKLSQTKQGLQRAKDVEKRSTVKRLLPRPSSGEGEIPNTVIHSNNSAGHVEEATLAESNFNDDKTSAERQLDERRRRHRESSAAYHARQRQRFQAQADEIVSLKARTEALVRRKKELLEENQTLRLFLSGDPIE